MKITLTHKQKSTLEAILSQEGSYKQPLLFTVMQEIQHPTTYENAEQYNIYVTNNGDFEVIKYHDIPNIDADSTLMTENLITILNKAINEMDDGFFEPDPIYKDPEDDQAYFYFEFMATDHTEYRNGAAHFLTKEEAEAFINAENKSDLFVSEGTLCNSDHAITLFSLLSQLNAPYNRGY